MATSGRYANSVRSAWHALRRTKIPFRLAGQMRDALDALATAIAARDSRAAPLAAIDVARAGRDVQLRYEPASEVDRARFGLWTRQLQADAGDGDQASVIGDVATLEWVRDRIPLVSASTAVDEQLRSLEGSAESGELAAAADAAVQLRETVAGVRSGGL